MGSWVIFLAGCTAVTVYTDCRWYWIPDALVVIVSAANGLAVWAGWVQPTWSLTAAVIGAMALLYWLYPRGLGTGDVKLMAALAIACPGLTVYVMVLCAFVSAAIVALLRWPWRRQALLPFGPFIWWGWWLAWGLGHEVLTWLGW